MIFCSIIRLFEIGLIIKFQKFVLSKFLAFSLDFGNIKLCKHYSLNILKKLLTIFKSMLCILIAISPPKLSKNFTIYIIYYVSSSMDFHKLNSAV